MGALFSFKKSLLPWNFKCSGGKRLVNCWWPVSHNFVPEWEQNIWQFIIKIKLRTLNVKCFEFKLVVFFVQQNTQKYHAWITKVLSFQFKNIHTYEITGTCAITQTILHVCKYKHLKHIMCSKSYNAFGLHCSIIFWQLFSLT